MPEAVKAKAKKISAEEAEERAAKASKQIVRETLPDFRVGDTVRVFTKIKEGDKERVTPFEGIVIAKRGRGVSKTFCVRRIGTDRVGIERIWPLESPVITKIFIKSHGSVRRAKLYYLRTKLGKAAEKIKERKVSA